MNPADLIVILVIVAIAGLAGWYVYKSKKSGRKCIGCPEDGRCSGCQYPCKQKEE